MFKKPIYLTPFTRYCLVGVMITIFDLGIVFLLRNFFQIDLIWAVFWGFILANSVSFVFNKYWTFKNYSISISKQYTKFLIVTFFGLILTLFFMWLFAIHWRLFSNYTQLFYLICKGFTSIIVVIWNFLSNKIWNFANAVRLNPEFSFSCKYPCFLSIVIPAYNEEKRIIQTLDAVMTYLETRKIDSEVLLIDDGSTDNTIQICRDRFNNSETEFRIIRNPKNHGKGFSVKIGIQNALGEYILFTDADNSTPIEEFDKFLPFLSARCILIGSRYLSPHLVERSQPSHRIMISRFANFIIQLFVIEGIKDTQCGFKVFHHEVANLFSRLQHIHRYAFDIELLNLAQLCDIEIKEIPVRWLNSPESRVRPIKDSLYTFFDILRIKFYVWSRRYSSTLLAVKNGKKLFSLPNINYLHLDNNKIKNC